MNKVIFVELANTWRERADMVAAFPTEDAATQEANQKAAGIMRACTNDLLNVIKLFESLDLPAMASAEAVKPEK